MLSPRTLLLLLAILIILCCTAPVMGEDAEEISYYDIYADVNGAAIYFDNEYMGDISNGVLTVCVVSAKKRPYYRVTAKKDEYQSVTTNLPEVGGELKHVSLFLSLTPLTLQTGTLSVFSSPAMAEIFVDGTEHGVTPQTITGLTPGEHSVRVVCPGYYTWSETAVVSAEETYQIDAYLKTKRAFGTLSVNSDPEGAEIYLDKWYYGITPMTVGGISEGSHIIKIKKDGYTDIVRTVIITDSTVTPVTITLVSTEEQKNIPCTLSLTSSPAGAMVCIDSVDAGETPVIVTDLIPGVHQIKLTKAGYQDYLGSVVSFSGDTRTLDITMQSLPSPEFAPASLFSAVVSIIIVTLSTICSCRRKRD